MNILKIFFIILTCLLGAIVFTCILVSLLLKVIKKRDFLKSFKFLFVDIFIQGILVEIFKGFHPANWFEEE